MNPLPLLIGWLLGNMDEARRETWTMRLVIISVSLMFVTAVVALVALS